MSYLSSQEMSPRQESDYLSVQEMSPRTGICNLSVVISPRSVTQGGGEGGNEPVIAKSH